ncbi:class I adenylate-forming enzyme family protein [Nesterenkonia sp. K-15-9-6]|uniref:class I adenylate-forming enzyme family protein n=1 Tax=Nesterenkonia sp. K-15-9-6 TaxID=3093918 RepID=UPI004044DC43
MFNLAMAVSHTAQTRPHRLAVVSAEESWTFAELEDHIRRAAGGLRNAGLMPGDTVALSLPTSPEFVVSYYAVLRAGLTVAPMAPYSSAREVRHALGTCGARALVTLDGSRPEGSDDLTVLSLSGLVEHSADDGAESLTARSPEDVAAVIFTSGTTGAAKAAQLTHWNLWMSCTALLSRSQPTADDVVLASLPLHHVFGMSGLMNAAMTWGMTLVLQSRFEAAEALDLIEEHRVTRFSGVPTMFLDMIRQGVGERDLSSLRHVTSGGSALPPGVLEDFENLIPSATLLEGYGSSETTSSVCVNSSRARRRPGSVGTPSWGTQMRVVSDDGTPLPPGPEHVGELQICGPTVFAGYAGDPDATSAAFDGDWLRTGDLAWITPDGYVHLVDRRSNMIIRGGRNVYPAEVEHVLTSHPDVAEAVVLGQPHERLGQEIAALVVPRRPTAELSTPDRTQLLETLDQHARQELAPYKRPRQTHLIDSLPRTAAGKIIRPAARSLLAERTVDPA